MKKYFVTLAILYFGDLSVRETLNDQHIQSISSMALAYGMLFQLAKLENKDLISYLRRLLQ